ncbi:type II toxin-antitoxin system death-on-curing family toxin [Microbacterium sp. Root180]|uniref:type II toxin-antitoxin system death-on-curing family toxin n=1 Tax=Microbacterium sp. Root180 TaxID=1736483 RepID=UPI0012FC2F01|nr:type II toxin-antitoxin system death-on-curing family toxin [Microbacterium sp. Root180]
MDMLVESEGWHWRDRGLALSALGAPLPVFGEEIYPGLHRKAAVLLRALNLDHPLLDGSKRLSWYLVRAFYALNGYDLYATADEGDRYIRLVAGEAPPPLDDIELWLDKHAHPLADMDERVDAV